MPTASEVIAPAYVGVDIGNTRVTVGAALPHGHLLLVEERAASANAQATVPMLLDMVQEATVAIRASGREVAGIGLGFGGPVDYVRQQTRQSFHSSGWDGLPLARIFADHFGIPAVLDNDANAGGLAEAMFGAGRGCKTVLYVNVGTGIGGAVILNGAVHHGATSSAGEIGHVIVDPTGPPCNCGKTGCLEALASGSAMERRAGELGLIISGRELMDRAEKGDEICLSIVREAADSLGIALANAVSLLDPEVVVLGGGVPDAGEVWWSPLRESFARYVIPQARLTPLLHAHLGYRAGVLGAAALAMPTVDSIQEGPHGD